MAKQLAIKGSVQFLNSSKSSNVQPLNMYAQLKGQNNKPFTMIDNYIYLYHTDTLIALPTVPESITDSMTVNYNLFIKEYIPIYIKEYTKLINKFKRLYKNNEFYQKYLVIDKYSFIIQDPRANIGGPLRISPYMKKK